MKAEEIRYISTQLKLINTGNIWENRVEMCILYNRICVSPPWCVEDESLFHFPIRIIRILRILRILHICRFRLTSIYIYLQSFIHKRICVCMKMYESVSIWSWVWVECFACLSRSTIKLICRLDCLTYTNSIIS